MEPTDDILKDPQTPPPAHGRRADCSGSLEERPSIVKRVGTVTQIAARVSTVAGGEHV